MWLLVLALAASAWGGWVSASVPGEAVSIRSTNTHLYVVGHAYDVQTWRLTIRIEIRDKASGQLVKTYTEPGEPVNSCVAIGGRLYLGRWFRISVYDPEPRRVDEIEPSEGANPPRGPGHPLLQITRLATDGSHIYVVGVVVEHGQGPLQSFIHKRSLNLTLLGERYFNLTLSGVGVNPATGHVWAVGGAAEGNRSVWIVLILGQNLNTVREARPGAEGWPYGVVFDDEGNAYVYGPGGVVKMSKDGDVVSRAEGHYQRLLYSSGRLAFYAGQKLGISPASIIPIVLGQHGESMFPVPSKSFVYGVPLDKLLKPEEIKEVVDETVKAGARITELRGFSSNWGPGAGVALMAKAVKRDERRALIASVVLKGEYGVTDVPVEVPIVLGRGGAVKVLEVELGAEEKAKFAQSVEAIRKLLNSLPDKYR